DKVGCLRLRLLEEVPAVVSTVEQNQLLALKLGRDFYRNQPDSVYLALIEKVLSGEAKDLGDFSEAICMPNPFRGVFDAFTGYASVSALCECMMHSGITSSRIRE